MTSSSSPARLSPPTPDAVAPSLSPARRRLIDLLNRVWFGNLADLLVVGGEPSFDPPPRATRTFKFGPQAENRPAHAARAGAPPTLVQVALLRHLAEIGDGLVRRIEANRGNPAFLEVSDLPPPNA